MTKKMAVITGGGTGGHVFPALAIAEELTRRGFETLYVGTERGMEGKLAREKQIPFFAIRAGAIKNQSIIRIIKTLCLLVLSWFICLTRFLRHRPQVVVGVGGYVSAPACLASFCLGIPVLLQEQNVSVGIANRLLGRLSRHIFLGFEEAKNYFNPLKCIVTGNPIRPEFYQEKFSYEPTDKITLLVMGGSQGAHAINMALVELLPKLAQYLPSITIIHQTGEKDFSEVLSAYQEKFPGSFEVVPFIKHMTPYYSKASLVICRAGALTVSELIHVGRPAILIPYPRRGQNDQTANAHYLQSHGAAWVVEQANDLSDRLWTTLQSTLSADRLSQMSHAYCTLRKPNALASIGAWVERVASINV